MREGLSYDDVLLTPKYSTVDSRSEVELGCWINDFELGLPIIASPMDTAVNEEVAAKLSECGGLGIIHRFQSVSEQVETVVNLKDNHHRVGGAVGIDDGFYERADALYHAGVDVLVVDVAHAHLQKALDAVHCLSVEFPEVSLWAGAVATRKGAEDLSAAGADAVRCGLGPGSHCRTREVAGVGVPQMTAIDECSGADVDIIADGGIRSSGDAVKAFGVGADAVMMGSFFMHTEEAPGEIVETDEGRFRKTRGMATRSAYEDREDRDGDVAVSEGEEQLTPIRGTVAELVSEFEGGIRSGLSYIGAENVREAEEKAEFVRVTDAAQRLESGHGGYGGGRTQ